jgi:uncharacterized protein (DUF302 family)
MPPAKLVIFGNPRGGTPLMIAYPALAIDLPLKALIWEDPDGKTWLSYNSVEYLQQRFGIAPDLAAGLEKLLAVINEVLIDC